MISDEESDSQHQEFVTQFYNMVQDINEYYLARSHKSVKKQEKARMKINFKMPSSAEENVFDIVSFNKNHAEKLVKPMRNQTKNLENSQVEPYIENVHQMLRHLKLKQQVLRNVQKYVYLNLIEYYKRSEKKSKLKNNCLHIYLAESMYANKMKEFVICKPQLETPTIVIPLSRKESTG